MLNKKMLMSEYCYNHATSGKSSNLYIDGHKLINYSTCIAYRNGNTIWLNATKYSPTTSRNQNMIRTMAYEVIEMDENQFKEYILNRFKEEV